jgi:predicted ATPase
VERGTALYDIKVHGGQALRYAYDPGVICLTFLARTFWMLGFPDRAVESSDQAVAVARATGHTVSIAEAMIWRADIALLRGDVQDARERAVTTLALATEYELPLYSSQAAMTHGYTLSEQGHSADGIAQIRRGVPMLVTTGYSLYRPYYLAMLSDALGKTGEVDKALLMLDEAIESYRQFEVPYWDAELQRRKGELLRASDGANQAAAEACFRWAIDIAQAQSARSLELRAATSLACLLAGQGKRREAHELLAPIYGCFTEGFETADLKDAKALLDELSK